MNDETDADEFNLKDNITVEGITPDYVWYNAQLLKRGMQSWAADFEKLVSVMEARHREHINMLQDVMDENKLLKSKLMGMNENKRPKARPKEKMIPVTSHNPEWNFDMANAPRNRKLLGLTTGDVAVIAVMTEDNLIGFRAWCALPKIPKEMK